MTRKYRRPCGLAVLVAVAAIGLAACSGGSSSPQVASLGTGSSDSSGSAAATGSSTATGNPTQLLARWTACMRSHGDTGQATPTIDTNKVIHVAIPAGYNGLMGLGGSTGSNSCTVYMNDASQALGGSTQTNAKGKSIVPLVKFAECMRANGVPDFPDPGSNGQGNVPPDSGTPTYHNASKICAAKTGLPRMAGGTSQPGEIRMAPAGPGGGSGANG